CRARPQPGACPCQHASVHRRARLRPRGTRVCSHMRVCAAISMCVCKIHVLQVCASVQAGTCCKCVQVCTCMCYKYVQVCEHAHACVEGVCKCANMHVLQVSASMHMHVLQVCPSMQAYTRVCNCASVDMHMVQVCASMQECTCMCCKHAHVASSAITHLHRHLCECVCDLCLQAYVCICMQMWTQVQVCARSCSTCMCTCTQLHTCACTGRTRNYRFLPPVAPRNPFVRRPSFGNYFFNLVFETFLHKHSHYFFFHPPLLTHGCPASAAGVFGERSRNLGAGQEASAAPQRRLGLFLNPLAPSDSHAACSRVLPGKFYMTNPG
uniref:Uncharacterized protein n=1 Tax=Anser brachyrhynchus TaxID=132585 RepID=A0A8B9CPU9_9AVES